MNDKIMIKKRFPHSLRRKTKVSYANVKCIQTLERSILYLKLLNILKSMINLGNYCFILIFLCSMTKLRHTIYTFLSSFQTFSSWLVDRENF